MKNIFAKKNGLIIFSLIIVFGFIFFEEKASAEDPIILINPPKLVPIGPPSLDNSISKVPVSVDTDGDGTVDLETFTVSGETSGSSDPLGLGNGDGGNSWGPLKYDITYLTVSCSSYKPGEICTVEVRNGGIVGGGIYTLMDPYPDFTVQGPIKDFYWCKGSPNAGQDLFGYSSNCKKIAKTGWEKPITREWGELYVPPLSPALVASIGPFDYGITIPEDAMPGYYLLYAVGTQTVRPTYVRIISNLDVPTLISPANGSIVNSLKDVDLKWNNMPGAGVYVVSTSTSSLQNPNLFISESNSTKNLYSVFNKMTYSWSVLACTDETYIDCTEWSPTWTFTTLQGEAQSTTQVVQATTQQQTQQTTTRLTTRPGDKTTPGALPVYYSITVSPYNTELPWKAGGTYRVSVNGGGTIIADPLDALNKGPYIPTDFYIQPPVLDLYLCKGISDAEKLNSNTGFNPQYYDERCKKMLTTGEPLIKHSYLEFDLLAGLAGPMYGPFTYYYTVSEDTLPGDYKIIAAGGGGGLGAIQDGRVQIISKLDVPTLISPANGSTVNSLKDVELKWNSVSGAGVYEVSANILSNQNSFKSKLNSTRDFYSSLKKQTFVWSIKACTDKTYANCTEWSPAWTFTTLQEDSDTAAQFQTQIVQAITQRQTQQSTTKETTQLLSCDPISYSSQDSALDLTPIGVKSDMCGVGQYFRVSIPKDQTCDLKWTLQPDSSSDYDLYVNWKDGILDRNSYGDRSINGPGQKDELSKTSLPFGDYYVMAYREAKDTNTGSYSITPVLSNCQTSTQQTTGTNSDGSWCYTFTTKLKYKDTGYAVGALQAALQKEGLLNIPKLTTYFGSVTQQAVIAFQEKYKDEILTPISLTKGTGYVGNATIKKLNELYGCK